MINSLADSVNNFTYNTLYDYVGDYVHSYIREAVSDYTHNYVKALNKIVRTTVRRSVNVSISLFLIEKK